MSESAQFLTFAIDRQRFGISIDGVREIIRAVRLAHLPKAPPILEGLVDLRGAVVPILDIRSRFRLPPKPIAPTDHIIVARAKQRVVGLRVDRVIDVRSWAPNEIEDIGSIAPASDYVAGVAKLPDGLLLIHDLATFLSEAEALALAAVVGEGLPS
jgi:purine-binding chemotaxis protein CheW